MKLIDLLVQELPKRGGWPDNKKYNAFISQDGNGEVWSFPSKPNMNVMRGRWGAPSGDGCYIGLITTIADDFHVSTVTREQYEAALAAAQQPVWDGQGLPPVGCRIEAFSGGEWVEAIVTYNEPPECHGDAAAWKEVLAFDCKTTRPFWTDEFRPIRSEADKRRDEAIAALVDFKIGYHSHPKAAEEYLREVTALYDAILRGDIPHIRIEQAA
ncbi:hypothetical protein ACOZ12_001965 [Cronobacter turicensis]